MSWDRLDREDITEDSPVLPEPTVSIKSPSSMELTLKYRAFIRYSSDIDIFITSCPRLIMMSQGSTVTEAKDSLRDSLRMQLEHRFQRGLPPSFSLEERPSSVGFEEYFDELVLPFGYLLTAFGRWSPGQTDPAKQEAKFPTDILQEMGHRLSLG